MCKHIKMVLAFAGSIVGVIFTVLPESLFNIITLFNAIPYEWNIVINRAVGYVCVLLLTIIGYIIWLSLRRSVTIRGKNYCVEVKYGDIFQQRKCKKVIAFDECFTLSVGSMPSDINPSSICGQYLKLHPIDDMDQLINANELKPSKKNSQFNNKKCYPLGTIVPRDDYLLLAFAKLNEDGLGEMTRAQFTDCLSLLWSEINKHYGQSDIALPVLGSGVTRFKDIELSQQELLDIMIASYRLSAEKIKTPNRLIVVCRKKDDFSLNKIGEYI